MRRWFRRLAILFGIVVLGVVLMGASVFGYGAIAQSQKCDRLSAQVQAALQAPVLTGRYGTDVRENQRRQDRINEAQAAYNRECR